MHHVVRAVAVGRLLVRHECVQLPCTRGGTVSKHGDARFRGRRRTPLCVLNSAHGGPSRALCCRELPSGMFLLVSIPRMMLESCRTCWTPWSALTYDYHHVQLDIIACSHMTVIICSLCCHALCSGMANSAAQYASILVRAYGCPVTRSVCRHTLLTRA